MGPVHIGNYISRGRGGIRRAFKKKGSDTFIYRHTFRLGYFYLRASGNHAPAGADIHIELQGLKGSDDLGKMALLAGYTKDD